MVLEIPPEVEGAVVEVVRLKMNHCLMRKMMKRKMMKRKMGDDLPELRVYLLRLARLGMTVSSVTLAPLVRPVAVAQDQTAEIPMAYRNSVHLGVHLPACASLFSPLQVKELHPSLRTLSR